MNSYILVFFRRLFSRRHLHCFLEYVLSGLLYVTDLGLGLLLGRPMMVTFYS